jgi:hypothetical protein
MPDQDKNEGRPGLSSRFNPVAFVNLLPYFQNGTGGLPL